MSKLDFNITAAQIVAKKEILFNDVCMRDTNEGYLTLLREMLFLRITAHCGTKKSVTAEKIQGFGRTVDLLLADLRMGKYLDFILKFIDLVDSDSNPRNCLIKLRSDDAAGFNQLRSSIHQLWHGLLSLVAGSCSEWIMEKNADALDQNLATVLNHTLGKLEKEREKVKNF